MLLESWRLELLMYEPRASPLTDTLTTQCIAVVHITLTVNIDRSPKHHQLILVINQLNTQNLVL